MVKKIIVLLFFYFIFIPVTLSHCGDCGVGDHNKKKDRASCEVRKSEACSNKKKQCSHDKEKETHTHKAHTVDQGESSQGEKPQPSLSDPVPALKQESR
ncbi:MAG: hypothetical protein OXM55_04280 [Bdellovibrionales bacterium]|nr:hypothetical protein [Bdellovibrionales bacterium]